MMRSQARIGDQVKPRPRDPEPADASPNLPYRAGKWRN
jgi:hypothetical protein